MKRIFAYFIGTVILLIAALFVGAMPVGVERSLATGSETVRIYVLSNGFHSDIAIPRSTGEHLGKLGIDENDFPVDLAQTKY